MSVGSSALPAALAGPLWHRFLSPHYDDIALSCGGTIAVLSSAGLAPEITVLFGDQPDPADRLHPFAAAMHEGWGLAAAEVIARRRQEEAIATRVLGATSDTIPFRDAIYRDRHYLSEDQLFGTVAAAEADLPDRIVTTLVPDRSVDPRVRYYAPLAVGDHVDHQHGFAVGVTLARAGWDVWYYEDLPYALNDGALDRRLASLPAQSRLEPAAIVGIGTKWDDKLAAILAYESQLATVFRYVGTGSSREEIDTVLRRYAGRLGDELGERFWRHRGGWPTTEETGLAR